jgi:hypothetical protein
VLQVDIANVEEQSKEFVLFVLADSLLDGRR